MKRIIDLTYAAVAFLAVQVGTAFGLTDTAQFQVTITIQTDCQITSATDLDFGTQGVLSTKQI